MISTRYFQIVSNFTLLTAREITYNNSEISRVVFTPNATTNHTTNYFTVTAFLLRAKNDENSVYRSSTSRPCCLRADVSWNRRRLHAGNDLLVSSVSDAKYHISLRSLNMRRKQNFVTITFRFFTSLRFTFLAPYFFFCWTFSRLPFGKKSFWESF